MRLLIVDDNGSFLEVASAVLEREGLAVAGVATTSADAMAKARELRPDVALVDVTLGAESGLELARRLGQAEPALAVILISTHSAADYAELIAETPAAGFVSKSDLTAAVIRQLASAPRGT